MLAFIGPGYLVAVGYMDPENRATSLAGGSRFGYTLLFVALPVRNIMAIVLQSLAARLAVGSGRDLAQACRERLSGDRSRWCCGPWPNSPFVATDLAEVIGAAIGLNLPSGLPLRRDRRHLDRARCLFDPRSRRRWDFATLKRSSSGYCSSLPPVSRVQIALR
jgi:NRAMP (natural resistance-associated macrophage protein)-like metal ion transporter